jgi:hypothetical protein
MRKLIVSNIMSLDSYFEGSGRERHGPADGRVSSTNTTSCFIDAADYNRYQKTNPRTASPVMPPELGVGACRSTR